MQQLCLAQNILILQILNETPVPPSENSVDEYAASRICNFDRVLSLAHERRLVEILTYWASSSDDPKKVMALCIEETKGKKAMVIRLAANHGGLEATKAAFYAMKIILEKVAISGELARQQDDAWLNSIS